MSTCDQQFILSCQEHTRSRERSASGLASVRWLLCGPQKRDLTSMTVPNKKKHLLSYVNRPARDLSPLRFLINAKNMSVSLKKQEMITELLNSKNKNCNREIFNHLGQDGIASFAAQGAQHQDLLYIDLCSQGRKVFFQD